MKLLTSIANSLIPASKPVFILTGFLVLTACCGEGGDSDIRLKAVIAQNSSGQGVAVWEQPDGEGIAIARYDSVGVWSGTMRTGSGDSPIYVAEITQPTVAGNGDLFVLWKSAFDTFKQTTQFHLSRYVAASDTWDNIGLPTGIASNPVTALNAQIAADNAGNAWLLWADGNRATDFGQIWVAHFDATTSSWDIVNRLDDGNDTGQSASIAVNSSGVAIAVWNAATGNGLWVNRYIAGVWETQTQIGSGLSGQSRHQRLALDDTGNVLMAWRRDISNLISEVHAVTFNSGTGLWSGTTKLDVDSFASDKIPEVSMRGTAGYVAWLEGSQLWAVRSVSGSGTFGTSENLANSTKTFTLVAATDGRAYLGWHDSGLQAIQVRTYLPLATGWSSFASVALGSDKVSGLLAASTDDAGNLVLLWQQQDDRNHPDPMMCDIEYRQVWSNSYDIVLDNWSQPTILDTKRTSY